MRINEKGQVTIPAALRMKYGLMPGTEINLVLEGERVRIVPLQKKKIPNADRKLARKK